MKMSNVLLSDMTLYMYKKRNGSQMSNKKKKNDNEDNTKNKAPH